MPGRFALGKSASGRTPYIIATFLLWILSSQIKTQTKRDVSPGMSLSRDERSQCFWTNRLERYPVTSFTPLPRPSTARLPRIQHSFGRQSRQALAVRSRRREAVKQAFRRSWNAYKRYAWLQDELAPITMTGKMSLGDWAVTLVDSLDALWIMDFGKDFEAAVEAVATINFCTSASEEISIFETTIRLLGGLLSAFDLSKDARLLAKALELADMLYACFDTPNRMPVLHWRHLDLMEGHSQLADENAAIAEIGSLALEFTRLTQLTGEAKWYDAIQRITDVFYSQQNSSNVPGIWPYIGNARTQDFSSGSVFTLGAGADSFYEYLPKMHMLLGGSSMHAHIYQRAIPQLIDHLLFKPILPDDPDVLVAGILHAKSLHEYTFEPRGEHLACFAGGMLALGGRLFSNTTHIDIGRKLTDGCTWVYRNSAPLGIMPEIFRIKPCDWTGNCTWNEVDDSRPPIVIEDPRYLLRPEAIESIFVLYRITGDEALQDQGWSMFERIYNATYTDVAHAALTNITDGGSPKSDNMESFWLAETLKYFYLLFSDPDIMSLDHFVFNTEAHPFRKL